MNTAWAKSSYSNSFSNCVEVRADPSGAVAVRDSKDRSGPILTFTHGQWGAFLAGIKEGELGVPAVPLVAVGLAGAC